MDTYLPLLAVIMDRLIGDPRSSIHPVVMIGNLISLLEGELLKKQSTRILKNIAGALLVILVLGTTYGLVWWIMLLLTSIHPWAQFVGGACY